MSFQGLSVAIETVRINGELLEIWPNEVCDKIQISRDHIEGFQGFSCKEKIPNWKKVKASMTRYGQRVV